MGALSRMSLGTQVGSELSRQRDQSQSPSRSIGGESALKVDQTKSTVEAYNQICTELQLTRDPVSGGEELAPLSEEDMATFEQLVLRVGLENILYVQPKQLLNTGVQKVSVRLRESGSSWFSQTTTLTQARLTLLMPHCF